MHVMVALSSKIWDIRLAFVQGRESSNPSIMRDKWLTASVSFGVLKLLTKPTSVQSCPTVPYPGAPPGLVIRLLRRCKVILTPNRAGGSWPYLSIPSQDLTPSIVACTTQDRILAFGYRVVDAYSAANELVPASAKIFGNRPTRSGRTE
jgi:hypothetical protein